MLLQLLIKNVSQRSRTISDVHKVLVEFLGNTGMRWILCCTWSNITIPVLSSLVPFFFDFLILKIFESVSDRGLVCENHFTNRRWSFRAEGCKVIKLCGSLNITFTLPTRRPKLFLSIYFINNYLDNIPLIP